MRKLLCENNDSAILKTDENRKNKYIEPMN